MITHQGGCHCGRVRFEVDAPAELVHRRLQLLDVRANRLPASDRDGGSLPHREGPGCADDVHIQHRHREASVLPTCGIKPFYVPRSHPDGWSVNARCIDSDTVTGMKVNAVDGKNWEKQYPAGRGEF